MSSSMMRFTAASGRGPSTPRPVTIQTRRSSFATTRITPSSILSRPTFQASATRIEYCSRLGLSGRQHQHRDLAALRALEIAQPGLERLDLRCGERPGQVGDARLERRNGDLSESGRDARGQDNRAGRDEAEPALEHGAYCFAGAAGLLKSTAGGLAMAFSSSTVKFGLTW